MYATIAAASVECPPSRRLAIDHDLNGSTAIAAVLRHQLAPQQQRRLSTLCTHFGASCQPQGTAAVMAEAAATTKIVSGLQELADSFDAFILDQWGVLHDGTNALPDAAHCLAALGAAGKKLVILSNDGARKAGNKSGAPSCCSKLQPALPRSVANRI